MMKIDKTPLTWSTAIGISLPLIGMPLWSILSKLYLRSMERNTRAIIGSLVTVGLALGVVAVVTLWEKKPLTEMGLRRQTPRSIIIALASSIVIAVGGTVLSLGIIKVFALPMPTLMPEVLSVFPVWLSIWLVVSGSVAEEILYRGFVIERIGGLTGNIWLGALITLLWFTALHLPLGWVYTISIVFPVSLLITILYAWRRDLVATIVAHFVFNAPLIVLSLVPLLESML